jgi:hypothetical protein
MLRALLAHPQEALQLAAAGFWCIQLIQHARNIPSAVYVAPPEDEQVMHETCEGA